uniref:SecY-independent transporter protein n=1 Tax=Gelidiella flabella TaxID=2026927 RepID=A0A7G9IW89_9FLOR|nr:SecY-independent transporter protein [Gelidiella flabella]QNM39633.1 SecY-independent transporter protein [Gelidiella flabella]
MIVKKNQPVYIYLNELLYRSFYIFLNVIIIALLFFYKYDVLFFIKTFPVILVKKKFIVTGVTELIELWWFLILSNTSVIIWPFFTVQVSCFLKAGLYKFQFYLISTVYRWIFTVYFVLSTFYYFIACPLILHILFFWGVGKDNYTPFMFLEIQPNVLKYINWISEFHCLLGFITMVSIFYSIHLTLSKNPYYLFVKAKNYKKIILFLFILFLFILFPSDFFFNIFIPSLTFMGLECLHLFLCFNLINKIKQ